MAGHDAGAVPYATMTVLRKFIHPMWVAFLALAWRRYARSKDQYAQDQ